jgi:hypothetical protein
MAPLTEDYNLKIGSVKSGSARLLEIVMQNSHAMSEN